PRTAKEAVRQRPASQGDRRLRDRRAAADRGKGAHRHAGRHPAQDAVDDIAISLNGGSMKRILGGLLFAVAAIVALPALAQKTVTFAYQDMMNPWRWVQQSQEIEKTTGFKINWRQFGGGGDVIRAMASGDVQLGEVGSTGIATAISQGMDVDLFWILEDIAGAEALVARNGSGVNTIADLKGKKIGTPFGSP